MYWLGPKKVFLKDFKHQGLASGLIYETSKDKDCKITLHGVHWKLVFTEIMGERKLVFSGIMGERKLVFSEIMRKRKWNFINWS